MWELLGSIDGLGTKRIFGIGNKIIIGKLKPILLLSKVRLIEVKPE